MLIHLNQNYKDIKVVRSDKSLKSLQLYTDIISAKRYVYVIMPHDDNELGSVVVKNLCITRDKLPISEGIKGADLSYLVSTYVFDPVFLNPTHAEEFYTNLPKFGMRLVKGIATGFTTLKQGGFINYGTSLLEVNGLNYTTQYFEDDVYYERGPCYVSHDTEIISRNPYLNDEAEYIGSLNPLYFTDQHYKYMNNNKEQDYSLLDLNYEIHDFCAKEFTNVIKCNDMTDLYYNDISFYYLDEYKLQLLFEYLGFISQMYDFCTLSIVIDNNQYNVDWNNVERSFAYSDIKNQMDMEMLLYDLQIYLEELSLLYNTLYEDYYLIFHINNIKLSLEVIDKSTGEKRRFVQDKGQFISSITGIADFYKKHVAKHIMRKSNRNYSVLEIKKE